MGEVERGSDTVIRVLTFALNQKNEILRGKNEARDSDTGTFPSWNLGREKDVRNSGDATLNFRNLHCSFVVPGFCRYNILLGLPHERPSP